MNRHASMNRIYRLVWSQVRSAWVPVAETARGRGKSGRLKSIPGRNVLAAAISLALAPVAHGSASKTPCVAPACGSPSLAATAHPLGGQVVSGNASITQAGNVTDIRQSSADVSIDWLAFSIGSQAIVEFIQPSASAIAVNRIAGNSGSEILGHLDANGQVYLINPNGIIFGKGAQVNVGGLVATTLDVPDSSLSGDARSFAGNGTGSILNQGTINAASGGYVALLGNRVTNQGVITAQLGAVALGAGTAVTLTFNGNSLVHLQVDRSVLGNLAANGGLIDADGGQVIMTAGAKDALLASVVNNTGVIEARTVESRDGSIELLGGLTAGTVNVAGTLDASAPEGGNGGLIETSAAHVQVDSDARITTAASRGMTGSWLVDPQDFTIAPSGGDISGAALSTELGTTSVTILSSSGAKSGSGNINVDDTVSWNANTLTLTAANNINVNAVMTATGSASLALNPSTANGADGAVAGGTVVMGLSGSGFTGMVNFNSTGTLSISGTPYTVINTLGAPGSTTGTDLQGMQVNLSGNYVLGTNIDASATSTWNSGAGFTPVGTSAPFTGTFDGLGHSISNLTINLPSVSDVGLFGLVGSTGIVRNVGLTSGNVVGDNFVGALVGYSTGSLSNSYATGSVSGPSYVGGLVGYSTGLLSNSYATGSVSGSNYIGGLVGSVVSTAYGIGSISNSSARGKVSGSKNVGGLIGSVGSNGYGLVEISTSYATGNVTGSSNVGGLVGSLNGDYRSAAFISGSFATGNVTGSSSIGGLVGSLSAYGYKSAASISGSFATGNVTGSSSIGGLVGSVGATAFSSAGVDNSYATGNVIGGSVVGGLVGSESGAAISNSYATGSVSASSYVGGPSYVGGLVGYNTGAVSSSYSTGSVIGGSSSVGGLVGYNDGAVSTSYTTGSVIGGSSSVGGLVGYNDGAVSTSYAAGRVSGSSSVGGLVGYNDGTVSTSYATGRVSGLNLVGGLVGYTMGGAISNSYATGDVTGSSSVGGLVGSVTVTSSPGMVSNSYATGDVTGSSSVGGLVGSVTVTSSAGMHYGSVINSYATGSVSGSSYVGGLVGSVTVTSYKKRAPSYGSVSDSYAPPVPM